MSLKSTKNSILFANGTIQRIKIYLDEHLSLSYTEKAKLLIYLKETLEKDYDDFEIYINESVPVHFRLKRLNEEYDKERTKDWHGGLWFLLIGLLICVAITCLYSYFH